MLVSKEFLYATRVSFELSSGGTMGRHGSPARHSPGKEFAPNKSCRRGGDAGGEQSGGGEAGGGVGG